MFRKVFEFLTLRPYGNGLCTAGARAWMILACAGILLMCSTEASSWAYVGYFLASGPYRYLAAAAMGLVAAIAVFIVDASFVMLDLRREEYQQILEKLDPSASTVSKDQKLAKLQSPAVGIAIRLAMVAGSLWIAAPYVSQLFFLRDVSTILAQESAADIQKQRNQVAARHDLEISKLLQDEAVLKGQLVNETAGHGPSHRYGFGPTAKTIEQELKSLNIQIESARGRKEKELRLYDSLSPSDLEKNTVWYLVWAESRRATEPWK